MHVDVRDGKILRIVPLELDESDGPSWTIHARGRDFTPPRRTTLAPYIVANRSHVYSPKRILTPLKRVDFGNDFNGDRNIHNRGVSGYEPISWDEALETVAGEIVKNHRESGPAAMLTSPERRTTCGHRGVSHERLLPVHEPGRVHLRRAQSRQLGGLALGRHAHVGLQPRLAIPEQYDLLEDALQNTEMIVFWSSDPESTGGGIYTAFESTPRRYWFKELGVKMVFIDPYFNHTAGLFADKWMAPRLGTDVALGLAVAYTWLTEGTYDKEYVDIRTVGFDEWKAYVLGVSDGCPKTPKWAEGECGIAAREIRSLAREWGAKKTMLAAGGKGAASGAPAGPQRAGATAWTTTSALAAMQGLGKPGVNIWSTTQGAPCDTDFWFPGYNEGGISGDPTTAKRLPPG